MEYSENFRHHSRQNVYPVVCLRPLSMKVSWTECVYVIDDVLVLKRETRIFNKKNVSLFR